MIYVTEARVGYFIFTFFGFIREANL